MNEAEARLKYEEIKRVEGVTEKIESLRPSYNPVLSAISSVAGIAFFVWLLNYTKVGSSPKDLALFFFLYILANQALMLEIQRRTHKRIDALHTLLKHYLEKGA